MKQEDKELLLKDLCSRLPYGVKVLYLRNFNHKWYNLEMVDIGDNEVYVTTYEPYANRYAKIEEVKPYLFPLSSMSDEQKEEYDLICSMSMFDMSESDAMKLIDWFHKNHIDYRGLIPEGLAIDATGLNIY